MTCCYVKDRLVGQDRPLEIEEAPLEAVRVKSMARVRGRSPDRGGNSRTY